LKVPVPFRIRSPVLALKLVEVMLLIVNVTSSAEPLGVANRTTPDSDAPVVPTLVRSVRVAKVPMLASSAIVLPAVELLTMPVPVVAVSGKATVPPVKVTVDEVTVAEAPMEMSPVTGVADAKGADAASTAPRTASLPKFIFIKSLLREFVTAGERVLACNADTRRPFAVRYNSPAVRISVVTSI